MNASSVPRGTILLDGSAKHSMVVSGLFLTWQDAVRQAARWLSRFSRSRDTIFRMAIPADIQDLYEVHNWRHAAAILECDFPTELGEICEALRKFRFTQEQVTQPGGNESQIPKTFSGILRPKGWVEVKLKTKVVAGERTVSQDTHKIDYCKGRIAFELEWNSKDQTFDRDLFAFGTFWEYDKISIGVLVTRSDELDVYFHSLGTYIDKHGQQRRYKDKFGASTTHMGKLLPRLRAGRSGGCPVLVFGITPRLLEE